LAQHSTNINNLRSDQILANLDFNSATWRTGANPFNPANISTVCVEQLGAGNGESQFHLLMSRTAMQLFNADLPSRAAARAAMDLADVVATWNFAAGRANFAAAYAAAPDGADAGFGGLAFLAHLAMNANGVLSATSRAAANGAVARSCEAGAGGNNKYIRALVLAGANPEITHAGGLDSRLPGGAASQTFANLQRLLIDGAAFGGLTVAMQRALVLTYINALENAASVAALVLTTEVLITEMKERKEQPGGMDPK
jgi:hypothetical protein